MNLLISILCVVIVTGDVIDNTHNTSIANYQRSRNVPEGQGWSGGWCLASMAEAGWMRSTAISSEMSTVLGIGENSFPSITATNSGGSMFGIRYFTLKKQKTSKLWNYPCYLLSRPYSVACFFHSSFGLISSECHAETFNVILTATSMAYGSIISYYGGPLGVASTYLGVYFPFLADLPMKASTMKWHLFVKKFIGFNTNENIPTNWLTAHTLDAPQVAGRNPYNYGFNSYLSRAVGAYHGTTSAPTQLNVSTTWMVAASANTQTGITMLPFALSTKNWDGTGAAGNGMARVFATVVSFVMAKRLMATHEIMDSAELQATNPSCLKNGCPIMDGGFTDNAPLTPILSQGIKMPSNLRPSWIISVGASSTMATVKYLMGVGALHVYEMGGINVCPFTDVGICRVIKNIQGLVIQTLPTASLVAYKDLGSAYQVFRPEIRLMTPYCTDPLTYDLFAGQCAADGMCDMWSSVIPSHINLIDFTPDPAVFVFIMVYLQQTPVSSRFVNLYAPQEMWQIEYYEHMESWFPKFDAVAPAKGGIGFTNIAGNSFMDFMTYLGIRLVAYISKTRTDAQELVAGSLPECHYSEYRRVESRLTTSSAANQIPIFR